MPDALVAIVTITLVVQSGPLRRRRSIVRRGRGRSLIAPVRRMPVVVAAPISRIPLPLAVRPIVPRVVARRAHRRSAPMIVRRAAIVRIVIASPVIARHVEIAQRRRRWSVSETRVVRRRDGVRQRLRWIRARRRRTVGRDGRRSVVDGRRCRWTGVAGRRRLRVGSVRSVEVVARPRRTCARRGRRCRAAPADR